MHENLPVFSDENASIMLAVLNQSFSRMHTRMYALTQMYKFTGYDDWCWRIVLFAFFLANRTTDALDTKRIGH